MTKIVRAPYLALAAILETKRATIAAPDRVRCCVIDGVGGGGVSRAVGRIGIIVALLAGATFLRLREPAQPATALDVATAEKVIAGYADLLHAVCSKAVNQATRLAVSVDAFLAAPLRERPRGDPPGVAQSATRLSPDGGRAFL